MDALPGLLVLLSALVSDGAKGPDEKSFGKSFESIQKLGDAGKWSDEKKALLKLLNETGDQPWVRSRRTEIVDELGRAAIRAAVPQPEPATMTDGKLLAWDRHSGDLSIVYDAGRWKDFKSSGAFFVHPAVFDGPVTIKVDGDDFHWFGESLFEVALGIHDDQFLIVAIGGRKDTGGTYYYSALCEFVEVVGKSRTLLEKFPRAPTVGNRFELEIVVGATQIAVNSGGSRLGQVKLPAGFHGQIGIPNHPGLKHVSLRGRASPAWLQGRLDAVTHDAEQKFLAKWKVEDDLPAWLKGDAPATPAAAAENDAKDAKDAAGTKGSGGAATKERAPLPWPLTEKQSILVDSLEADLAADHADLALAHLEKMGRDALPADVADYYFLTLVAELGGLGEATERLEAFCARNPGFAGGRILHAKLQVERNAYDEAAKELAALHGEWGDPERLAATRVQVELLRAKPEEAQRILREARADGVASPDFDELDELVVHILRGPNFPKRFEQKSPHFALVTDIDNDTARDSLKVLEESYSICAKVFGQSDASARPFPVYFFSGRAGYIDYGGRESKMAHSTAGMYSRLFKHLLVWNQPDRGETARTLRHEATHQYLDLLGYHVPVWFNEGLAVYVELIASSKKADLTEGAVDRGYVNALYRKEGVIPLKQFTTIGPASFYKYASVTYPEAWALVHFLRHGEPPHGGATAAEPAPQEVNARLMAALQKRLAPHEVIARAFQGVDLERFQKRFFDHVDELRAEADKR